MFMTEEELAIQIAEIDCVEIDNMNFTEPRKHEILQQFAADAPSADEKYTRLSLINIAQESRERSLRPTSLILA